MRKKLFRVLSLLLVFLMLLGVSSFALADAGGFSGDSDYGGGWDSGSDWDSSDWGSDDYYSDSGSGTPINGFVVVIVIVIVLFSILKNRNNKNGGNGGSSGSRPQGGGSGNKPTVDPKELKQKDPNFSEQALLEKVSNAYVQMQNCWQDKKWEPMRALMTDALYSQFERQLDALKRNGQTNYVERISVLGARIVGYYQDKVNDNLVIELRTRIVDYTVNDETGAVVSGSKTAEKFMTYEWTLIRSIEQATKEKDDVTGLHCPNCGAPLNVNHSAKCEYCGQVITVDEYDWVISQIKGISQVTKG
ncbi:MAG: TIM44-like domain-containing protein [Candidatus Spyradocola sp.]